MINPRDAHTRTTKGERTKARILGCALKLFREHGYEATTMRQVADAAGVAVGNAYYYFASKEHLVQGFYAQSDTDHQAIAMPALEGENSLRERLRTVLITKIEVSAPDHQFAALLFKTAADPSSPLNPFSSASSATRLKAVGLMSHVVEGSDATVPGDIGEELPNLLWLYEMAVILFWIHDRSPNFRRTRRLIDHTSSLVARLLSIVGLPLMGPIRKRMLDLLEDLRPEVETDTTADETDSEAPEAT